MIRMLHCYFTYLVINVTILPQAYSHRYSAMTPAKSLAAVSSKNLRYIFQLLISDLIWLIKMLEYYRVKSNSVFHYFRKIRLDRKIERFKESSESNDHKNNKVKFSPFRTISEILD